VTGQTSPGQQDRWDSGECPAGGLDRRSFLHGMAATGLAATVAGNRSSSAGGKQHSHPVQAPALPGAQPISDNDRVYTADQDSNTVSVISPKTNTVLGTIALGNVRLDTNADVLGP
jgi:YVTN family beta-propeller protein